MNRRRFKSPIPRTAREVIDKTYEDGMVEESSYFVGRTRVGRRIWWDDGLTIEFEYGLKRGKRHGNELRFYPDGNLLSVEPYRDGKEHGKAWQFARDGSVLITYVMNDGVGLDLWCHEDGSLAEEYLFPAPASWDTAVCGTRVTRQSTRSSRGSLAAAGTASIENGTIMGNYAAGFRNSTVTESTETRTTPFTPIVVQGVPPGSVGGN